MKNTAMIQGDSLELLRKFPDQSIDCIITDPPYGLGKPLRGLDMSRLLLAWVLDKQSKGGKGFMGKDWDASVPSPALWRECLRVLKPGGHAFVFAGTRTQHLMSTSLALAGFEIRDCLLWLYSTGFPKSQNVSKAIDKAAGAERQVIGRAKGTRSNNTFSRRRSLGAEYDETAHATDEAKRWQGWGTALKPAHEPIIMARKPLCGTIAANVQKHGTGGINVDACRIPSDRQHREKCASVVGLGSKSNAITYGVMRGKRSDSYSELGRWPANVILDEEAGEQLDAQSGSRPGMSGGGKHKTRKATIAGGGHDCPPKRPADCGGASRFFYCPKANSREREAGLEDFEPKRRTDGRKKDIENPRLRTSERRNVHPTVKPISLMRWLVRLGARPGALVLDPFAGSGTTGIACELEGVRFVGLERDPEYVQIARARIAHQGKTKR